MESPLNPSASNHMDRRGDKMNGSMNSNGTLEDTTPSDSGVQMLDSESSELMIDSITSQTGFEFDETRAAMALMEREDIGKEEVAMMLMDTNSNVTAQLAMEVAPPSTLAEDIMTTSACSTFDAAEPPIVYRRKARKTNSSSATSASAVAASKAPKKRVSFHEDILKNTRTDNIHIEHGFITYKGGRRALPQQMGVAGRYSWCSEGDSTAPASSQLCASEGMHSADTEGATGARQHGGRQGVVYRNACSDVLDYGNSDAYDTHESKCLQYDNSGVFEYVPRQGEHAAARGTQRVDAVLYRCSCSSSNSSLDSEESGDKNSNQSQRQQKQYGQAKSSSCDCIGMSNAANNNIIGDNCYFSEPNMDNMAGSGSNSPRQKSVWNKEKKPKSSCLKKGKRHTHVIHEQDLSAKVKKFNVHDMNQLLDNSSKMLFGSLKSIFTMLPERGVPEGSEDLQAVAECVPELEQTPEHKLTRSLQQQQQQQQFEPAASPTVLKEKPFLSKSLDGSKQTPGVKQFVHNVDEQLRRKNDTTMFAPTRQSSDESDYWVEQKSSRTALRRQQEIDAETVDQQQQLQQQQFRSKFIINCESTVFEHTGVSYETNTSSTFFSSLRDSANEGQPTVTPPAHPESNQMRSTLMSSTPIAKTFTNFFRSFKESSFSSSAAVTSPKAVVISTPTVAVTNVKAQERQQQETLHAMLKPRKQSNATLEPTQPGITPLITTPSSSGVSEMSSEVATVSNSSSLPQTALQQKASASCSHSLAIGQDLRGSLDRQSRHLPSPLKQQRSNVCHQSLQPARYGYGGGGGIVVNSTPDTGILSPDLFNCYASGVGGGGGRDSKTTILSEEFDDILTITTTTELDRQENDIVIVDYPLEQQERNAGGVSNLLKPPAAKTSLINRFLRNVTQKKILEASIRQNDFFSTKLRSEQQRRFAGNLYVRGAKPKNYELIDDLNAEIAMEIEMSGANSPRRELANIDAAEMPGDVSRFELGIGEISIDIFNGNYLHILRDSTEQLLKVFKLYTGYSREGCMTPVLVFLTDRTLYVTDLVRNRLCSKFMLAYADLDVILMGPYGNTVLLSNSARDMQQVLLAGGPYPADRLVANLELCARRSGSTLPAVGQLTLQHLAPLQAFVRENSCVGKTDSWMYYAVINVPAGTLGDGTVGSGSEREPLGPHIKGFLMQRRSVGGAMQTAVNVRQQWNPGYFLLKAGVLYMFNDSSQKLPSWAMALAECQGARRTMKAGRPYCFEILLKGEEQLQLAAPDEYVASEWLQALLQSASGLFEMQEKHKTLGCTLVVTQNHLITLREDFTTPLRQINKFGADANLSNIEPLLMPAMNGLRLGSNMQVVDGGSMLSSAVSTPTRSTAQRSCSSLSSTPTRHSQLSSRSSATGNTITSTSHAHSSSLHSRHHATCVVAAGTSQESFSNMSSVYGKNAGVEILTCADIKEMTGIKIPSHNDTWWCILEFSCQEVRECTDDLVIFFASSSEMQRFLRLLEQLWQAKNNDLFPITILDEDDVIAEQCTMLYMDINRSWEPLLSAALGYPL